MNKICMDRIVVAGIIFVLMLGGCTLKPSAPTKFYMLSPLATPGVEKKDGTCEECMAIGIGPVYLSAYLDRPEIVTRVSPNELKLADFDNWAEPLQGNFTQVLMENISRQLSSEQVVIYPWKASLQPDFQIYIEVIQMDGKLGESAVLVSQWTVINASNKSILFSKRSRYAETIDKPGYLALVAAESRMVGAFSRDIAETIESLHK